MATFDGLTATPICFLAAPGNMLVAYLLTDLFPMGDTFFGTIVSLTSWFNVLQLPLAAWMRRHWRPKSVSLAFCWVQLITWFVLAGALPFVPEDNIEVAHRLFFALFSLSALSSSLCGVMWNSWVQEWIPERVRGKYFGFRNSLLQIANVAFLLSVGEVLARFEADERVLGFQLLVGGASLLRIASIFFQLRIHSPPTVKHEVAHSSWREQLQVLRSSPAFVRTVAFGALWTVTTSLFGPFFMRFMLEGLKMPPSEISRLIITGSVTGALSLPAWGQMIDRHGCRSVLIAAMTCWLMPGVAWTFATPESHGFLIWMWASGGVFGAGFVLAQFTLLLKVVPPEAKTIAVSVNVAVGAMLGAIAPIAGGAIMEYLKARGHSGLWVYQHMSLVHHMLPLSCIFILRGISEPRSATLTQLFGAMRSFRAIAGLMGMTFLENYIFIRRRR